MFLLCVNIFIGNITTFNLQLLPPLKKQFAQNCESLGSIYTIPVDTEFSSPTLSWLHNPPSLTPSPIHPHPKLLNAQLHHHTSPGPPLLHRCDGDVTLPRVLGVPRSSFVVSPLGGSGPGQGGDVEDVAATHQAVEGPVTDWGREGGGG